MNKIKVCIIGMGEFSDFFIPLFRDHPDVEEVSIADVIPERVTAAALKHGIKRTFSSLEDVLKNGKDVDSIALFTQRHLHGPMVIDALKAGKHVFSAVPMAISVEECGKIIDIVKETRQIYMTGETCYYFPCAIFCRDAYKKGKFGEFVYGESQYYHDMKTFYSAFARSGGDSWKRVAGIPPMYYSTHSVSMIVSVIGQHATKVSCCGYRDHDPDEVFGVGKNNWDNPFSNQTALLTMSGGGIARVNEFRRVGIAHKPSSYITCMYGTTGAYECTTNKHMLINGVADPNGTHLEDVSDLVNTMYLTERSKAADFNPHEEPISERGHKGFSPVHDIARLPLPLQQIPDTVHYNSHPFLVDDFVRAVLSGKLPPNHAWDSARYMIPGLIAHESALKDGMPMDIPDFGDAPADWDKLYE
ncbi:MAG: Gfo/Idh/MocA family oxidoreductase [Clostridia bacterium]|nr:Gfo/Idh/MocA family oxidoreductase [Clostridia bacterium]